MEQSYFKEYYQLERVNWWFIVRRKILAERIGTLLNHPTRISSLNVGAATGTTSDMLTQFGEVMSVEYDEDCCKFTQPILSTPLIQGSITELPFENDQYDLVCAFDVIEHVEDDQKAINELFRVCKPGGHIAITVPAYAFLWGPHDVINQHFRRYTLPGLLQLFNKQKGRIIYKTYFNSILFLPIAIFRVAAKLFKSVSVTPSEKGNSDHEIFGTAGFFNSLLAGLFNIDYHLLKHHIRFPAGVSIMVFFKKEELK
ncbi:MAG: methyltransferase domain-containing protein [Sediminibacterium sp.]|nr:methyltransferase domain-containing protein [Sediminibacterium sp.]